MSEATPNGGARIGYVVKVYPRYSETFIVNEILAHEAAGLSIDIFSLRPPRDTHFQDAISRVRAPVTYLPDGAVKIDGFWKALMDAESMPGFRAGLDAARAAGSDDVLAALFLAREVRLRHINHLHAHFASGAASVARIAAAFAGVTYTLTAHAKDIFHESVRDDDLERKLRDAAATITVSDYNVGYLKKRFGPAASRLMRIYNGLDLDRFAYGAPRDDRSRRIAAVGRLVEKKGFATLVEACALMRGPASKFVCEIIGTGEQEGELRAQIERLGLDGSVLLRGPQPQTEVIEAIRTAAALAVPCVEAADGNRDGLPTVILEAMAVGTPCVATDVTGIPEVVEDGNTGLMVRQRDAAGLAAALERLLEDPPLRVRLAAAARRRVEAGFDGRQTTAVLREVFEHCIAGHAAREVVSCESPTYPPMPESPYSEARAVRYTCRR
jgi:colanic acid/amylovoran biosynthesis glycosyltransferase